MQRAGSQRRRWRAFICSRPGRRCLPGRPSLLERSPAAAHRISCGLCGSAAITDRRSCIGCGGSHGGNRSRNRHGQKTEFYHHTCGSKRTALIYIQLAENRVMIEKAKVQSSLLLSIEAALRLIRQANGTSRSTGARSRAQLNLSTWLEEEVTTA